MYLNKYVILSSLEFRLINNLHEKRMLILFRLTFLNLRGFFIKLNANCPQNPFLHTVMGLIIHILVQSNLTPKYVTNQP